MFCVSLVCFGAVMPMFCLISYGSASKTCLDNFLIVRSWCFGLVAVFPGHYRESTFHSGCLCLGCLFLLLLWFCFSCRCLFSHPGTMSKILFMSDLFFWGGSFSMSLVLRQRRCFGLLFVCSKKAQIVTGTLALPTCTCLFGWVGLFVCFPSLAVVLSRLFRPFCSAVVFRRVLFLTPCVLSILLGLMPLSFALPSHPFWTLDGIQSFGLKPFLCSCSGS